MIINKKQKSIPKNWHELKLEDIAICLDNRRIPLNSEERMKKKGNIPYCGANGIVDYIDEYIFDEDIILIAEDGGNFNQYQNRSIAYEMKIKCWVNNHAHVLKSKDDCSQSFLFYSTVHKNILRFLNGGTRAKLNKTELLSIKYFIPKSIKEQNAIVSVLETWDKYLEKLSKKIEIKNNIKKGLMQKLLSGNKRLKGFSGEWKKVNLGDVVDIKTGKKNNQDKNSSGKYPFFVRSQNIEKINSYSYDGEAILLPGEGNIGKIFHYINGKFDYHQRVYKVSGFNNKIFGKYVYYYFKQKFLKQAKSYSVKATVDSLRLPTFKQFEISLPEIKEQQSIAKILTRADEEIEVLKQKKKIIEAQKKYLLNNLITGKIRTPEFSK